MPPSQDADAAFHARVNTAIDRGVQWLKKEQRPDGSWPAPQNDRFESGVAALGFLTLVKSGVGESDPSVQRCIRYFGDYKQFEKTYSTGVLMMAWEALKRGAIDRPKLEAGAKWLLSHRDEKTKLWAYPEGDVDGSNTQYALLGLYAASRAGVDVPQESVFQTIHAILKLQQKDGGCVYRNSDDIPEGSMTTATIAALEIGARLLKGQAAYEARKGEWAESEKRAFAWLENHFRVDANPAGYTPFGGMRVWHYYYLYGLERAAGLAGRTRIGKHAWYREGAEYLLSAQDAAGHWKNNFSDTCFALLFLKRATLTWSPEREKGDVDTAVAPVAAAARPATPRDAVPFLKQWLLAGPYITKKSEPLSKDEIGESSIRAAADGEAAGSSSRRWKKIELQGAEKVVDLEKRIAPYAGAFSYGFAVVQCKKDTDAVLWLGHDDGAKVWLNGKVVYENETYAEGTGPDMYYAHIKLKRGPNPLLIKVYNASYGTGFCARVALPDGSPID
jgi:hypothetical protein